jgi:hypothetical protein
MNNENLNEKSRFGSTFLKGGKGGKGRKVILLYFFEK